MRRAGAALLGLASVLAVTAAVADDGPTAVDLEIVLAVDASGSVDGAEWRLQMDGIAAALRDEAVQAAILAGPTGAIAAAIVVWADATMPKQESGWAKLDSPAAIADFARMIEEMPRTVGGGTGIGDGLAVALDMIGYNRFQAPRQVVDVSGDGRETPPREEVAVLIGQARGVALQRGVTVNGLAILTDEPELAAWYRAEVIAGPASFVMTAADYGDFARAMREKLLREIEMRIGAAPAAPRRRPVAGYWAEPSSDMVSSSSCLTGLSPWATRRAFTADRVSSPHTPSMRPGSKPMADRRAWSAMTLDGTNWALTPTR